MEKQMKTSVALACYNGERYILEQLESITKQTVLPDEVVISDDGSIDRTISIVRDFIKTANPCIHFKIYENQGNTGPIENFENAIKHASNELVFLCDQDDIWVNTKLETMINIMQTYDVEVAFHDGLVIKRNEHDIFVKTNHHLIDKYPFVNGLYMLKGDKYLNDAFNICSIQGMCICGRKDYLLSIMPFSRGFGHDYWILFCATADDTLLAVDKVLTYYRIHENNTCGIKGTRKKSLIKTIKSFDAKGKESILKQYAWYADTVAYLNGRTIKSKQVVLLYHFFTDSRLQALRKGKILGTVDLIKEYKSGVYKIDGKIVFAHDLFYLWMHTKRNRKAFLATVNSHTRIGITSV